jgi:hypothetical protein
MEIKTPDFVVTLERHEADQLADDLNIVIDHLAKVIADAGDIDMGDPLAALSDAARRVDLFRMALQELL